MVHARAMTGHNATYASSTKQERYDAASRLPQAPSTCDKLRSYLQSPEDWAHDFLWAVFNDWFWRGCPEEHMPDVMRDCLFPCCKHGVRFTVDAPQAAQDALRAPKAATPEPSWVDLQVAKIQAQRGDESIATEQRWHAGRMAGEARRGAVIARLS